MGKFYSLLNAAKKKKEKEKETRDDPYDILHEANPPSLTLTPSPTPPSRDP